MPSGFKVSTELCRHYLLTRIAADARNLIDSVNHLSKVIYEGATKEGRREGRVASSSTASIAAEEAHRVSAIGGAP